jgi:biotin carboxyl carrier protein
MTFEIEIGGRRRAVSIESRSPGHYRIVLDGVAHDVAAERVGALGFSILAGGDGRSREITVAPAANAADAGELLVGLDGRLVAVSVDGRRRRSGPDGAAGSDGEQAVTAPMPGRVVRVLVAPGDTVAARQGVVVVEAMKMENELRTPRAGVVKDVAVTPGTLVEAGRVLVVVT